ncbi:hypothetical protein [Frankia tisae]|uniref:hypothetical protein n=1 Tax=Frankia tisae TaxID=2950104 RepID=UPI0021C1B16B|nr:hypothetical protein [Frankia tisae]
MLLDEPSHTQRPAQAASRSYWERPLRGTVDQRVTREQHLQLADGLPADGEDGDQAGFPRQALLSAVP